MKGLYSSIIALFVLASVALIGTAYFYAQVETERKSRIEAEKGKGDLEKMIQEKEKALEEKSQSLTSLGAQVDELKAEIRTKNQEIAKNRDQMAKSESKIKDLTEKNRMLEKDNKALTAANPEGSPSSGTLAPADPTSQTAAIGEGGAAKPARKSASSGGKVILVNREYHFIVAGIGKLDGVNLKDQMEIVRGDQVIGKAVVSKLYDSISSCEILQEGNSPAQEGDWVRILTKA